MWLLRAQGKPSRKLQLQAVQFSGSRALWNVLSRPLFFVSGVFYIYGGLPQAAQDILWWNSMIHVTGLMRTGFYSTYNPTYVLPILRALMAVVPMAFGLMLLRRYCQDAIYK